MQGKDNGNKVIMLGRVVLLLIKEFRKKEKGGEKNVKKTENKGIYPY